MEYGLIGEKLTYSFSKIIHEQIADYTYDLCPLSKEEFKNFMEKREFKAINVTIPYKQDVIPYLYEMDENSKNIGAVNTIVNRDGKLYGYNTDFYGFLYQVQHNNVEIEGKKVIVLGNGGASKAIIAVLKYLKAREIHIVYYKENPNTITYDECYEKHSDADVIVNTTPLGMLSKENKSPVDLDKFNNLSAVLDIVYNPLKTKLILWAEKKGIKAVNGLEMLVAQAKYAVEYFIDTKIDNSIIDEISKSITFDKSNLVLIGMPSAGKTTIGKICAKNLNKEFIDLDDAIVKKIGMEISEYFALYGEEKFREVEKEVCAEYGQHNGMVIATGGGAVKNEINMENLKANGVVAFIERDIESLSVDPSRPLSKSIDILKVMYKERLPLYKKYADISVYNNGINKCAENLIAEYKNNILRKI